MRFLKWYALVLIVIMVQAVAGCGGGGGGGTVVIPPPTDTTAPTVGTFTLPATSFSMIVTIANFSATDAFDVTGYLITESATAPSATAAGWSATVPTSYVFSGAGILTAYAWAKDAAGNVSTSHSATVTITLTDITPPTVTAFTLPATSASLTVAISSLIATDAEGITGYLVTESDTPPSASASGWVAIAPSSFVLSSFGTKTVYAWAKDAAGHVSTNLMPATVTMQISVAISTAVSVPTAVSTISISGISDPIICGIDLRVTYPSGTNYDNDPPNPPGIPVDTFISLVTSNATEADLTIFGTVGFGSGDIAEINYYTVPVDAHFGVSILGVFDCSGNQIQ